MYILGLILALIFGAIAGYAWAPEIALLIEVFDELVLKVTEKENR